MKKIFIVCLLAFICGCATKTPEITLQDKDSPWNAMLAASAKAVEPCRLQLTIRAGEEGDTRHITGVLWGNPDAGYRLDIMAGVGVTVAKISDSPTGFLLYQPRDEKAYFEAGAARPVFKIGVPVPFTVTQLADLLCGRYSEVFGTTYEQITGARDGLADYAIAGELAGDITLNAYGAPLAWKQRHGGWSLKLAYDEESPLLPKNIRIENVNGKFAFIRVRQRELLDSPFAADQLKLTLPSHIKPLPFSKYAPGKNI